MRRLGGRTPRLAGAVLVVLFVFVLIGPLLSPYGPNDVDLTQSREPPSLAHPLGTDQFGRDLLTRLAAAGRTTLLITALALTVILVIGCTWGTLAALAGGKVDSAMMRIVDGLLAIPRLPVAIVILVVLSLHGQNVPSVALALSIAGWMLTARLVRGHVLTLRARDFVVAARALGARGPHVARRHILPNSTGVVLVAVFLEIPTVVVGEAFLSILGLGPQPPTATWGSMAEQGWHFSRVWEMFLATAAIVVFATCANVLADAFQESRDPRRAV